MVKKHSRAKKVTGTILIYIVLVVITLITIYPIVQIFGISLRPANELYSTSLRIIPENASFESYRVVLFEKDFFTWLRNSVIVAVAVSIFGVTLASTSGYAFSRFRFRGRKTGMIPRTNIAMSRTCSLFSRGARSVQRSRRNWPRQLASH